IKDDPEDFVVEEIPLYEPDDDGQHVYVKLTRTGMTTREVVDGLAELFGIAESTIGYAGLKDKQARATQTFSLDSAEFERPKPSDGEVAEQVEAEMGVEVEFARRHRNKLRRGHSIGNRFRVLVRGVDGEADVERAQSIAEALIERGVPNFYGAQRFGRDGDNAEKGRAIIK
ncbi:MAG: tRNA pseudouridine(13) synthase TruD, partial [Bradymonadaceae bacterium]